MARRILVELERILGFSSWDMFHLPSKAQLDEKYYFFDQCFKECRVKFIGLAFGCDREEGVIC